MCVPFKKNKPEGIWHVDPFDYMYYTAMKFENILHDAVMYHNVEKKKWVNLRKGTENLLTRHSEKFVDFIILHDHVGYIGIVLLWRNKRVQKIYIYI